MRFTTVARARAAGTMAALALTLAWAEANAQSPFGAGGSRSGRSLDSALPNEAVDPFSGTLSIVETDLVLPGNAGLDLRVQRVYSSAIYPGYEDDDLTIEEDSWAGIGWKLHFGRVINPGAAVGGATQIEMGDGGRQGLYTTSAFPEGWITKSFWRYDRNTHTLMLPNGIVYEFGHSVFLNPELGTVRYVTVIRDPFNNRLEFSYFSAPGPIDGVSQIRQILGGGQVREVNFTYDATLKGLSSMTYGSRVWTYTQEAAGPAGYSVLRFVRPPTSQPTGAATEYQYSASAPGHELTLLRTPGGGTVAYTYTDVTQRAGSVTIRGRGVATKALAGPYVTAGTWTYAYGTGANQDTTTVACPCGTTTYRFNGIGVGGNFSGWLAGSLAEQTVEHQGTVYEREQLTWISSEQISADPTVGTGGVWSDPDVFKPLLQSRVVTRGGQSWTTTLEYHWGQGTFNDFGRPWTISEDGELDRVTRRYFQYGFSPYIVDRLAREDVTFGAQGFERNWAYNLATGFLTSQALGPFVPNGMTTAFESTPQGNVDAVVDPRGNRTTFLYSWGRVSKVTTPHVVTTYVINADGTTASEETGGLLTQYEYDAGFRPTVVRPPANTQITTYEYDNAAAGYVVVRRLPSVMDYRFDGFGRVRTTIDAVNLKTRVERDACGRLTFESYPYTNQAGTRGIVTAYDALGRVTSVTDTPAVTQYTYDGIDVTVTDPNNRVTRYEYSAFSGPASAQLVAVRDADQKFTTYTYDVFGNLTRVIGPNATGLPGTSPTRTWAYDGLSRLLNDVQPEKGQTTYVHDAAGNVTQVTDASGTIVLHYDGNNRLWKRDAAGTADDLEISYGTFGEVQAMASPTLASPTTRTTFGYDGAGRVSWRTDLANGQTFNSSYQYFVNDRLDRITYPSGRAITYEYDAEGRPTIVKNNGATFANQFTYSDAGRLAGYSTGTVAHTVTYDARERVQRITAGQAGTGLDLTYGYDAASQVRTLTDPRPGMNQAFEYDAVGRLYSADGPWGALRWAYDPAGNRLTETRGLITNYYYDAPTQRLTSTGGAISEGFSYDSIGRLATDSRGTYTYNARSLLATVTASNVTATYQYDPAGLRALRTVNGNTTYTVRGVGGEVLSEYVAPCGAPVWARDVVYVGGRLLGAVRANLNPPTVAVTAPTATVPEAQPGMSVGIRLTTTGPPTTCAVTVAYQTRPGTATVGGDFQTKHGTVTFAAGTPSATEQLVPIVLLPDTSNEPSETFVVAISSATGATVGALAEQTITIQDDDAAPAMAIEAPANSATVKTPFVVSGWAIDETVPTGTGVDMIHIYATPTGGSAQFLGAGTYGQARPDIGALYGSRFTNSGYTFTAALTPGSYTLTVYARNSATGVFNQAQTVVVTVAPANPQMALESPAAGWHLPQPFNVTGWAIDLGAGAGTGVNLVEVYAYPNPGSGTPPIAMGAAAYGGARTDIAQSYGAQFLNSGYTKEIRGLTPGVYQLLVQARSTVTGTINQSRVVTLTVYANPTGWLDTPANGTTINQTFTVGGWAIDLAAASGTGVSTIHVWAHPTSGAPSIFLGVPTYGGARPDVGAYYGSQFTNSGYGLTASLAPGGYQIVAYAWSTVTQSFNSAYAVNVTVATSQPAMVIDTPGMGWWVGQPFAIGGWAIDLGAPAGTGTGVDIVHVHAIVNGGAGAWTFLGAATYGGARPDVGAYYGSQFTNSGYGLTASGLAPGYYQINVYAHSTVSGLWTVQSVWITVV
jgi:YD repeat-containing protein